jgi:hypothetical protein
MLFEPFRDQGAVFVQNKVPLFPLVPTGASIYARGTLSPDPCPVLDLIEAQFQDVSKIKDGLPDGLFHGLSFAVYS